MNFNKKLVLLGLCIPLAAAAGCSTGASSETAAETTPAIETETETEHIVREDGLSEEDIILLEQTEPETEEQVLLVETAAYTTIEAPAPAAEEPVAETSEAPITPVTEEEWFISPEEFRYIGTFNWNGYRWTYYSERVLPGGGLNIPGRWSDTYFVRDGEGNICLASSDLGWGTYVPTPWGQGRVYDSGCASGTLDVYVTW